MLNNKNFEEDLIVYCERLAQELFDQGIVRDSKLEISASKVILELVKLIK